MTCSTGCCPCWATSPSWGRPPAPPAGETPRGRPECSDRPLRLVALRAPHSSGPLGPGPSLRGVRPGAGLAALERTALVLRQSAPDAGVLTRAQRPVQAGLDHRAA